MKTNLHKNRIGIHVQQAILLISLLCLKTNAAISINGTSFETITVNDSLNQASTSDYSCTQSGESVTLSGKQPTSSAGVTYYCRHASEGEEKKFMASINLSNLTDTNSLTGIE